MPANRELSKQQKGGHGKQRDDQRQTVPLAQGEMVLRARNAPNVQAPRANQGLKVPGANAQHHQAAHAPDMVQRRPKTSQQQLYRPQVQAKPQQRPPAAQPYNEWEDKDFLPLGMRPEPPQQTPAPKSQPDAPERYINPAPAAEEPRSLAEMDPNHPNPMIRKAVAALQPQPAETLQVGSETYIKDSTLQVAKSMDGGMSQGVYVVRDQQNRKWVAKQLSLASKSKRERSEAEVQALKRIKAAVRVHENLNVMDTFSLPENAPQGAIVLEYCEGGTLAAGIDSMKRFGGHLNEGLAFHFFYGIAKGLAMLHHGFPDHRNEKTRIQNWTTICHLDIKPANILLTHSQLPNRTHMRSPRVILADFGCSVTSDDVVNGREGKIVQDNGTPGWFPPEEYSVTGKEVVGRYGKPTDIWQAGGVIQAVCLLLYQPDMNRMKLPLGKMYGPELNCLVGTCMSGDYSRRPTAIDLCKELRTVMMRKGYQV